MPSIQKVTGVYRSASMQSSGNASSGHNFDKYESRPNADHGSKNGNEKSFGEILKKELFKGRKT